MQSTTDRGSIKKFGTAPVSLHGLWNGGSFGLVNPFEPLIRAFLLFLPVLKDFRLF
jgi:hypothetical protein